MMGWFARTMTACATPFRILVTQEGRRGWALMLMTGGGIAMTTFAGFALWFVRTDPSYAFYLGAGALALVGIVLTGFAALLVKRTIKGSIFGNSFEISDEMQAVAQAAAVAAVAAMPATDGEPKS